MNPQLQTPRLDRLRAKHTEAHKSLHEAMRRMDFREQQRYTNLIKRLEEQIADEEAYLPRRLAELLPREVMDAEHMAAKIIKMHIAADYLTDCAMDMRLALKRHGLHEANLLMQVDKIERLAAHFAAIVCTPEFAGLSDFMTTNDRLLDDMHLIVDRYLNEHLKIK